VKILGTVRNKIINYDSSVFSIASESVKFENLNIEMKASNKGFENMPNSPTFQIENRLIMINCNVETRSQGFTLITEGQTLIKDSEFTNYRGISFCINEDIKNIHLINNKFSCLLNTAPFEKGFFFVGENTDEETKEFLEKISKTNIITDSYPHEDPDFSDGLFTVFTDADPVFFSH
jgi:hypothetical protein